MKIAYLPNFSIAGSLAAQIRVAEQRVWDSERTVACRACALGRQLRRQMTAPATLLLAGGVGFVIGEFARREPGNPEGSPDQTLPATRPPLETALKLVSMARSLYAGLLPLAWLVKSFTETRRNTEQNPHPKPTPAVHPAGPDNP